MSAAVAEGVAYALKLTRTADKAQRKLDKPLRLKILEALHRLAVAPDALGERLKQPLVPLRTHHVTYQGKEYRIAYQIEESVRVVVVLLIGPHENFYRQLKQRLDACDL